MSTVRSTMKLEVSVSPRVTAEPFVIIILVTCIFLQRFGVQLSEGTYIPIATPIVLGMAIWLLHTGILVLDARRTLLFSALVTFTFVSTCLSLIANPPSLVGMTSFQSVAYALLVTSFLTLSFAEPMREDRFFKLLLTGLTVVAIAGILQFIGQFFGMMTFTYSGIVPDWLLMENGFAPD